MERLDQYLFSKGFLPSRDSAQEDIKSGLVLVNGTICLKSGYKLKPTDIVQYMGEGRQFVSRGAAKLLGARAVFSLDFNGKACIDVGASTGGFTQLMLSYGAKTVAALDVGHNQLDKILQTDPRVTEYSGVNFRAIPPQLQGVLKDFDFLTMDVSFISVCLLAESVKTVLKADGEAVILIKPQYEAGRGKLNKNGVLKDYSKHVEVIDKVTACYRAAGFSVKGLTYSPLQGPEGNIEYLLYLQSKTSKPTGKEPTASEPTASQEMATKPSDMDQNLSKSVAESAFMAFSLKIRG